MSTKLSPTSPGEQIPEHLKAFRRVMEDPSQVADGAGDGGEGEANPPLAPQEAGTQLTVPVLGKNGELAPAVTDAPSPAVATGIDTPHQNLRPISTVQDPSRVNSGAPQATTPAAVALPQSLGVDDHQGAEVASSTMTQTPTRVGDLHVREVSAEDLAATATAADRRSLQALGVPGTSHPTSVQSLAVPQVHTPAVDARRDRGANVDQTSTLVDENSRRLHPELTQSAGTASSRNLPATNELTHPDRMRQELRQQTPDHGRGDQAQKQVQKDEVNSGRVAQGNTPSYPGRPNAPERSGVHESAVYTTLGGSQPLADRGVSRDARNDPHHTHALAA